MCFGFGGWKSFAGLSVTEFLLISIERGIYGFSCLIYETPYNNYLCDKTYIQCAVTESSDFV